MRLFPRCPAVVRAFAPRAGKKAYADIDVAALLGEDQGEEEVPAKSEPAGGWLRGGCCCCLVAGTALRLMRSQAAHDALLQLMARCHSRSSMRSTTQAMLAAVKLLLPAAALARCLCRCCLTAPALMCAGKKGKKDKKKGKGAKEAEEEEVRRGLLLWGSRAAAYGGHLLHTTGAAADGCATKMPAAALSPPSRSRAPPQSPHYFPPLAVSHHVTGPRRPAC